MVVDAGGVLDITGAVPRVMLGSLVNEAGGTVNHSSIGTVSVSTAAAGPSGEITNRGVWRLTQDNATTTASGATANPGSFVNEAGAILERDRASGASTNSTRFTTGIEVTNHGTITTTNGELTIDAVAAIGDESVVGADAGTVLELTGDDAVVSGASDVTGTGVVELRGRYVMDPGAEIDAATGDGGRSELSGNLAGSGVLRVSAVGVWSSGTVEDGASLVVDAGGVLDITGAVPRVMLGSLVNEAGGTVNHSSIGSGVGVDGGGGSVGGDHESGCVAADPGQRNDDGFGRIPPIRVRS